MIRAHPHLGGQITEHMILLMIFSTHAFSYHGPLWISKYFFRILLVLLCYKEGAPQKGQLDSCRSSTRAMVCRRVEIDRGLCRSVRIGRAPREESRRCFGTG